MAIFYLNKRFKNMKRTVISSLIVASAFISGIAQAATVNGGTVNFEGELVNAACAVKTQNLTVPMGQFRTASFASVGATSGSVPFNIELTGCDSSIGGTAATGTTPAVPGRVAVGFTGVVDSTNPNALALSAGAGSASGVALRILDKRGTPVALDGTAGTATPMMNGDMKLPFSASYISTAATVQAGTANATALFTLTYQ
ncbi:fimbrial protein (plasmid) [Enterobacter asburiae]|uniref:fimbrial protein n=1 Tax=Enterobacter asburiae TaxID=61645 RepID=UPI0032AF2663